METTRRGFLARGMRTAAAAAPLLAVPAEVAGAGAEPDRTEASFKVYPVGRVEKKNGSARIRILDAYKDALLGLDQWSHVNVFWWFDKNDVPEKRRILRVHPRGNRANPETGVFACRAPVRPNLVALTVCKIVSVAGAVLTVDTIDAFDGTPVIDLKPFIPPDAPAGGIRVPAWAREKEVDADPPPPRPQAAETRGG
jgi:tRNA (adenine37-N6)-methyltransferase